jgi:hypothetical protein
LKKPGTCNHPRISSISSFKIPYSNYKKISFLGEMLDYRAKAQKLPDTYEIPSSVRK